MTTKICSKCKVEKSVCEFPKSKRSKDGLLYCCKECNSNRGKTYRKNNPEKVKKRSELWAKSNPEKVREKEKRYIIKNKEKHLKRRREYEKKRKSNDIAFKLKSNYSSLLSRVFKNYGVKKPKKTIELLGCEIHFFKEYIGKKLKDGMTFENYGKWHIDHIIPLSSAGDDLNKLKDLCYYTNLQPLWAIDNIRKSNKITYMTN
jgi:hypothetical protein